MMPPDTGEDFQDYALTLLVCEKSQISVVHTGAWQWSSE